MLFLRLHLNSSDHKKPHPIIADLSSMFAQNFYNKIDFCSFVDFLYGHKNLQCKCKSDFFSSSVLVLTGTRLLVSAKEQKKQGSSEIANKQKRAGTERGEHLFKSSIHSVPGPLPEKPFLVSKCQKSEHQNV